MPRTCLICFHVLKDEEAPIKQKISWRRIALRTAIGAGIVATLGLATAALYDLCVTLRADSDAEPVTGSAPSAATVGRPPADRQAVATSSGAMAMFGKNPWYKGMMDHPDSCTLMPADVTPKGDAMSEGASAYVERTDSRGNDYALTYTDGSRSWIYASSISECRRVADRSFWRRAMDAATE